MKIYVGYDEREDEAYRACARSILNNSKQKEIAVYALVQEILKNTKYYYRDEFHKDEIVATEFAFTRFLVPFLCGYQGWAVFCDCDFIFTRDIFDVLEFADERYAVSCVKHDYIPKDTIKMDNQKQIPFPRKNWSSMMLFNCAHPSCAKLTPKSVSENSAAWLHQMQWANDDEIGELPLEWNWLVGEYQKDSLEGHMPAVLHYTLGCPFMEGYENCDFADEYNKYAMT